MLGELVAAALTQALVLLTIDCVRLGKDLARDPLVIAGRTLRRVRVHLRPVDRDHPDPDQARLGAQPKHLAEQVSQRDLVALAEPRDRRVIGHLVGADHARCHILDAAPLDPPRRPLPTA